MQLFFDAQKLLRFFFFDRSDGHAGPAGDNIFYVFAADDASGGFIQMIFFAQGAQVLALLALFIGVETRLFKLMVCDGIFHPMHDELNALLDFRNFFR